MTDWVVKSYPQHLKKKRKVNPVPAEDDGLFPWIGYIIAEYWLDIPIFKNYYI